MAWDSDADIVALLAGSQSGKTSWAPWWLSREVKRHGAGDYIAVTASYDLFKLKMLPAYLSVFCDILKIGRYWAVDKVIELRDPATGKFLAQRSQDPMWGRVILRSAQSPGGLESATAWAAHADEAGQDTFGLDSWRALNRRLYARRGRILITTTLYNLGWLKQQIIDPVADKADASTLAVGEGEIVQTIGVTGTRSVDLIQFDSVVNPAFPAESWEDAKATMPPDEFAMFFRGRVAKLRSLVYDVFDKTVHVRESFKPPAHWPRYVGIDPTGDRIAALWLAWDDQTATLHVYREYCEPFGITMGGHVQNILARSAGERIYGWIGGGPSERQQRTDWAAAGIPLVGLEAPLSGDVWAQIGRVYSLLKTGNLVFHDCCEGLISEAQSMRRKKKGDQLTMEIENKDIWHELDALRYVVSFLADTSPRQEVIYRPERIA